MSASHHTYHPIDFPTPFHRDSFFYSLSLSQSSSTRLSTSPRRVGRGGECVENGGGGDGGGEALGVWSAADVMWGLSPGMRAIAEGVRPPGSRDVTRLFYDLLPAQRKVSLRPHLGTSFQAHSAPKTIYREQSNGKEGGKHVPTTHVCNNVRRRSLSSLGDAGCRKACLSGTTIFFVPRKGALDCILSNVVKLAVVCSQPVPPRFRLQRPAE